MDAVDVGPGVCLAGRGSGAHMGTPTPLWLMRGTSVCPSSGPEALQVLWGQALWGAHPRPWADLRGTS